MTLRKLLPVPVLLLMSYQALLGASAQDLLHRAQMADEKISYRGMKIATVVVGSRNRMTAVLKVVHMRPDKTRTEYYSPDPLAGIVIIENGSDMWRWEPDECEWEKIRGKTPASSEALFHQAIENYSVTIIGSDKVAGRDTYVIFAEPKHKSELARRVWVDREHFLIIRTQSENPSGQVVNASRYSSVEINPSNISANQFKPSGCVTCKRKPGKVDFKIAKPAYMPAGYKLLRVSGISVNGDRCAHLQYSNGVSTISIFQRKSTDSKPPMCTSGKANRMVSVVRNKMRFTLIGDVSVQELKKIAQSIK